MDEDREPLLPPSQRSKARTSFSSTVLFVFLAALLWLGIRNEYSVHIDLAPSSQVDLDGPSSLSTLDESVTTFKNKQKTPDFSQYIHLRTVPNDVIDVEKPERRVIIVGDIHGMKSSFDQLMQKLNYNPQNDFLIHVGDFLVRGPGSLALLSDFAARNVSGVRGNHDQKVIEWRAFIDWVESQPGGKEWLEEKERQQHSSPDPDLGKKKHKGKNEPWKLPGGLEWGTEHWEIARKMSQKEYDYLRQLPLVLHLPSLHTHVVHAGLLPADPTKDLHSPKQPLSHLPDADIASPAEPNATEVLRIAQEISIVEDVPQNTEGWNNLNMRSVHPRKGTVSRKFGDGIPWFEMWNDVIGYCHGFHSHKQKKKKSKLLDVLELEGRAQSRMFAAAIRDPHHAEGDADEQVKDASSSSPNPWHEVLKKKPLDCHPTTVVYGHSASRGLDLRRWTKGLDTGCAYGRELTALVLGEPPLKKTDDAGGQDEVEEMLFGEHSKGRIVSVSCK